MNNLNFATKTWLRIICLVGAFVTVETFVLTNTHQTSKKIAYINTQAYPFKEICNSILNEYQSLNTHYTRALLTGDSSSFKHASNSNISIKKTMTRMGKHREIPLSLQQDSLAINYELENLLTRMQTTYAKRLSSPKTITPSLQTELNQLNLDQELILERLITLNTKANEHLEQTAKNLQSHTTHQQFSQTLIFIFSLVISLPFIVLITNKYTLNPMKKLMRFIRGENDLDMNELPNDEIRELANNFLNSTFQQRETTKKLENEIKARQKVQNELTNQQEHVETIVEKRTESINSTLTHLKQREAMLIDSAEKLQNVFSSINEGICLIDIHNEPNSETSSYSIVLANKAFNSIFDQHEPSITSSALNPFLPTYEQVIKTGCPATFETFHEPTAKLLSVSATKTSSNQVTASFYDITDQKREESDLLQSQKLESVGQLASGIAHEINTPIQFVNDNLNFITGAFTDLINLYNKQCKLISKSKSVQADLELQNQLREAQEQADIQFIKEEVPSALTQSLDGANRVSTIVRAMKEFAHPGTNYMENINLNDAIKTTITIARNEWKYVSDLDTDLDASIPEIPCIRDEFNQVILNLIVNARDAIAERNLDQKGQINISTRYDEHDVIVTISDTGNGIPTHIQSRIFDPFFTTKEVGRGSGQGLAISYNVIVTKLKGKLDFETQEGQGTTFTIRLPYLAHSVF